VTLNLRAATKQCVLLTQYIVLFKFGFPLFLDFAAVIILYARAKNALPLWTTLIAVTNLYFGTFCNQYICAWL
jgi:hypothetical protein